MTVSHRTPFSVIAMLALATCAVIASVHVVEASSAEQNHFSKLDGDTIRMEPSGASFKIPPEYGAVNVTRAQLDNVRRGRGEWYAEYASIVNAALPFSDCSAQAGTYAWGAATFAGVQMRAYVLDSAIEQVQKRISTKGLSAAKKLPSKNIRNAALSEGEAGPWHRVLITYDAWYSDYGGRASVEFYLSSHQAWTIVLVFMHVDSAKNSPEVEHILRSFSWQ